MDKKAGLIYYICDRKACANCDPNCKHTNKIAHAKNFTPADINGKYPVKAGDAAIFIERIEEIPTAPAAAQVTIFGFDPALGADKTAITGGNRGKKMKIGLYDVDSHNFPNLALMKISAYHKALGDNVEFVIPLCRYDRIYASKVFGDEYTTAEAAAYLQSDDIRFGGTGFAIKIKDGKEVYEKSADADLPPEIEHIYPDYSLYPNLTKNTAYGFLTRGCPNNCGFCIVSKKEGLQSRKVANLSEFWRGQKRIKLLDANILACRDRVDLLRQLRDSGATVDFTQGLDARFVTEEIAVMLNDIKAERLHFAFDFMKNEKAIVHGLQTFRKICTKHKSKLVVYMLTNYDTTIEEDLYRVKMIDESGFIPDVRIYRKPTAPRVVKDLQRWCNNRIIHGSCDFMDYIPRADGRTIRQLYFGGKK